jgi:hypothetical protein
VKKYILYILIAIVATYAVRELLYMGIRKNKIGEYDKLNTIFLKTSNFENIIIGSSRSESHFNPDIIKKETGLSTYNMGMEGEFMPLILGVLRSYLEKNKPPKRVFLNVDIHPYTGKIVVNRFPRFFAYLNKQPLYKALQQTDERFWAFKFIPFYSMPYFNDKYLNAALRGYTGIESTFDKSFANGYVPIPDNKYTNLDTADYTPFLSLPQPIIFSSLDSIIKICSSNNIKLYFVFTPMYYKGYNAVTNGLELTNQFKSIALKNNLSCLDYSTDSICNYKSNFADPYHLNKKGAEAFSNKFAKDIIPLLYL